MRRLIVKLLLVVTLFGLNSCVSSGYVSSSSSMDFLTEVYYETENNMLVVYIESVPHYMLWNSARQVYYYKPVPNAYWRYIQYRPHYYKVPSYYRHLPNPYFRKYHHSDYRKNHYNHRYHKQDKDRKPRHDVHRKREPNRPSNYTKPLRPDNRSRRSNQPNRR